jgi:hypothetical protein
MTLLVRIYESDDYSEYTDTEHSTYDSAYSQIWLEKPPLPLSVPPTVKPGVDLEFGFAIANDGIWIHSSRVELVGEAV